LADPLVASVLLPPGIAADAAGRALVKSIQATDRPALVTDDADLRAALEADGVHLTDAGAVAALRRKLGDGLIVGAECPAERHACMEAAENGADYVAVRVTADNRDEVVDLLVWWQEVMTVPIVALLDDADDRAAMAAHADFISPPHI
jgi:thiamine-phosphate pyrophosphorylase